MRAKSYGQSALLLLDVVDILNKHKIPYAIIGAMAASFYGVVRASLDADAIISLKNKTSMIDKLKVNLKKARLKVIVKLGDHEDPLDGLILIEDDFGNQVDLILGIKGMDEGAFKRIRKVKFQNKNIFIIGIEDFLAMKVFAGSSRDINDVLGALEVSYKDIDQKLLKKLTLNYGEGAFETLKLLLDK